MATKKKSKKKPAKAKKAARKKAAPKRKAPKRASAKRAVKKAKAAPKKKKPVKKPAARKAAPQPRGGSRELTVRTRGIPRSGELTGDLQGLSRVEDVDSESVEELLEEGNAFEADVVSGVEDADAHHEQEVHTHEVPEDDVPSEYLDED